MSSAAQEEEEQLPVLQQPEAEGHDSNDSNVSLEELLYSSSSYHAIAGPVTITMILSALAVTYINTEETIREGEQALSSAYEAFDNTAGGEASTAQTLGISLLNALVMVSVICVMTFVIVLLYKYRCMKLLLGYMIFASATLLGFLGGVIFDVAVNKYELDIDQFSFYFTLWNFAAVGTAAIFWQKGIPMYVTQGYLIATSVILAWQLSHFDDWTSWTLLIMLAFYDLCAVLTPCGPLKALVNLMQNDDAPDMPGLLYEAQLPQEARRPGRGRGAGPSARRRSAATEASEQASEQTGEQASLVELPSPSSTEEPVFEDEPVGEQELVGEQEPVGEEEPVGDQEPANPREPPLTGMLPFAIAKLYRLPLTEPVEPQRRNSFTPLLEADEGNQPDNPMDTITQQYTLEQLVAEVEVIFPHSGGRIDRMRNGNGDVRFVVKDRHGEVKRILLVNDETGRVMEERRRNDDDDDDSLDGKNTIKLGLGDFIFYSLMVSKAAQYSFTTFVACMLVILAGLGGTLILLAVYRHALPALPISIFLGVLFYVLTRLLIEPWIEQIFQSPLYV